MGCKNPFKQQLLIKQIEIMETQNLKNKSELLKEIGKLVKCEKCMDDLNVQQLSSILETLNK